MKFPEEFPLRSSLIVFYRHVEMMMKTLDAYAWCNCLVNANVGYANVMLLTIVSS